MAATRALVSIVVLLVLAMACTGTPRAPHSAADRHVRWLIIAPHPDDEALIAGGILARASRAREPVAIVVMTNGDYDCIVDGLVRQGESLRGLAALGVSEDRVQFLGYPDNALAKLGATPLPPVRRILGGRCTEGNTTYGTKRGAVLYTRDNAVSDLARLLREVTPDNVVVTHPEDTHPDHATTHELFRDALDRVSRDLLHAPRVHRAMVHNGDCWPMSGDAQEPCPDTPLDLPEPTLALTGRLAGYVANERLSVSDDERHLKIRAISAHTSQTHGSWNSYLFAFARSDEMFFLETPGIPATAGGYRLESDAHEARLYFPGATEPHKVWPLPHDLGESGADSCALTAEKHEVLELTLRCRTARVGTAVALTAPFDAGTQMP